MVKSITVNSKKGRGRPQLYEGSEGKGAPLVGIRLPPDELAEIDDWIAKQDEPLSRPVAIRRLIKIALTKSGKHGR